MVRRFVTIVLCGAVLAATLTTMAQPATAATYRTVGGVTAKVEHAVQARDGSVTVTGWAFRRATPNRHMLICVWSNNACQARVYTRIWRPAVNNWFHIRAYHGFRVVLPRSAVGPWVTVRDYPADAPIVSVLAVSTPGARIVSVARRYVGRTWYRYGGASPAGFDCSGYTLYSYAQAGVARLPHSSQAQRYAPYMHRIAPYQARAGDLVFYLSGGSAYHVAIYAGHGMQYAAAVPGERMVYQHIWSSSIEYRTDWH